MLLNDDVSGYRCLSRGTHAVYLVRDCRGQSVAMVLKCDSQGVF